jgi:1-deoxy-D-xylulose-5-phosphate reductoisomerase
VDLMLAQCAQFAPRFAVMASAPHAANWKAIKQTGWRRRCCMRRMLWSASRRSPVDAVMAAIVGAAGLAPCLAAAKAGKRLLLANKEALVVGGACSWTRCAHGATLLPIDSEHSAIFQCLPEDAAPGRARRHLLLTASGGPFRQRDPATLSTSRPTGLRPPNFSMGRKISVDSATMMNKALEVIEARWLFGMAPERSRW